MSALSSGRSETIREWTAFALSALSSTNSRGARFHRLADPKLSTQSRVLFSEGLNFKINYSPEMQQLAPRIVWGIGDNDTRSSTGLRTPVIHLALSSELRLFRELLFSPDQTVRGIDSIDFR